MYSNISLQTFLNESEFLKLKAYFLAGHAKYKQNYILENNSFLLTIDLKEDDIFFFDHEGVEISQNFYSDIVFPAIKKMPGDLSKLIIEEARSKAIYSDSALQNYGGDKINEIDREKQLLRRNNYLPNEVKEELLGVLDEVHSFIQTKLRSTIASVRARIPLSLNRTETVLLFKLLTENEYIIMEDSQKKDFFSIIDDNFEYYDSKSQEYKPMAKTRKLYNDLFGKSKKPRPYKSALDDLEKKLKDDDFYQI